MGMFDTFHSADGSVLVQLKNGPCLMDQYTVGDRVNPRDFPDAYYYGHEGVVVIRDSVVESVTEDAPPQRPEQTLPCLTKWGGLFSPQAGESLSDHNPIAKGLREFRVTLGRDK